MSGYCKALGVRFNKIRVFRVKKQITLESALVNMLESDRKLLKIIIKKDGQEIFDVKILKVIYCLLTMLMRLPHGGSWIT